MELTVVTAFMVLDDKAFRVLPSRVIFAETKAIAFVGLNDNFEAGVVHNLNAESSNSFRVTRFVNLFTFAYSDRLSIVKMYSGRVSDEISMSGRVVDEEMDLHHVPLAVCHVLSPTVLRVSKRWVYVQVLITFVQVLVYLWNNRRLIDAGGRLLSSM